MIRFLFVAFSALFVARAALGDSSLSGSPASTERLKVSVRASEIDPRVKAYPEIGFLVSQPNGKPADEQQACCDPSVNSRGQLVIWLMS